ncbi:MAG TPA: hypothetical protein VH255_01355 [Verrucomicrobiae bacterium]|jgi:hypothetical protein|nr:hypothetical protein [Verrucomicrobiae bacterium]
MNREQILRRRLKLLTWFFIIGLVLSGATAMPLETELKWLVKILAPNFTDGGQNSLLATWLVKVQRALQETGQKFPFLFYGTDWLAFGHYMIALSFVGALRDPVRNRWLFDFGLIACVLVVPFAFICGAVRGIPYWWGLVDCSFGVFGFIPLWICRSAALELESSGTRG